MRIVYPNQTIYLYDDQLDGYKMKSEVLPATTNSSGNKGGEWASSPPTPTEDGVPVQPTTTTTSLMGVQYWSPALILILAGVIYALYSAGCCGLFCQ